MEYPADKKFETLVFLMTSPGDSFETRVNKPAAVYDFSVSGWEVTYANDADFPTYIVAQGPAVDYMQFSVNFKGTTSEQFSFQLAVLFGDELLQHQTADRKMPGKDAWWFHEGDEDYLDEMLPIPIPLPAPVWLGMAGIGGVVILRRRKIA